MKSWLRGIPGSVRDLQPYLEEYTCRFNRHKSCGNIFNLILKRMVDFLAITYSKNKWNASHFQEIGNKYCENAE